jgi:DNA-binding XRE family transcriptional regulator
MAKGKYEYWLTPEGLLKLEAWARDGLTDEQIASNMGITRKTLFNWKEKYLPILHTLKRGKDVVDIEVENALLKRALGYSYEEKTWEPVTTYRKEFDDDGNEIQIPEIREVLTKRVLKHQVPDTTAQIFWLKNRKPKEWRDKQELQYSGEVNITDPYDELTVDELKKLVKLCDENEEA